MSMISGLIDELNKSADEWNTSNMFELARMCREAADTIWKLRDDLQRANAENAKLRAERDEWHRVAVSKQDIVDHMRDARAENAKLLELVKSMYYDLTNMTFPPDWVTDYEADMRELGVDE